MEASASSMTLSQRFSLLASWPYLMFQWIASFRYACASEAQTKTYLYLFCHATFNWGQSWVKFQFFNKITRTKHRYFSSTNVVSTFFTIHIYSFNQKLNGWIKLVKAQKNVINHSAVKLYKTKNLKTITSTVNPSPFLTFIQHYHLFLAIRLITFFWRLIIFNHHLNIRIYFHKI